MSTILQTEQTIPTGTWTLDTVHSTVGYAVRHSGVSLFKGGLTDFDAERFPRVSFTSTAIRRDGDAVTVEGELEIRGAKQPVTLTGQIAGPVGEKSGLTLETVIDRTSFGMSWNMELPSGGSVLDNEVRLTADLELKQA